MKSILLASASVLAFAGAAAAEITFSGEATLGYNDDNGQGNDEGFYSDLDLTVGFSQELDNGLTVGASIDINDLTNGDGNVDGKEYELFLTSENAGLYYGSTAFAAETMWVSAGTMQRDSFSEQDGEEVLRGEVTFGGVTGAVSYALSDDQGNRTVENDLDQLSVAVSGDFGGVNVVLAYQEETGEAAVFHGGDFNNDEVFGISVGTSFAGADVRLAYASTDGDDSIGISVAYPISPVTASFYYVSESATDDSFGIKAVYADGPISATVNYEERQRAFRWNVEGSYDVGNGLTAYAGVLGRDGWTGEAFYVAGAYDLGGGAGLLVSYADASDTSGANLTADEIGAGEYQNGTTVELTFAF